MLGRIYIYANEEEVEIRQFNNGKVSATESPANWLIDVSNNAFTI